ncbi:MAG: glucosamine-6-phosphate deaminase [Eubacteriales bacterium]|nr:glucosamine-6-phosphate deaminase [Eubacteriales bacterium]MDD4582678.1 glucosamine-6-phosphate deaminase [Eubacteriales bacterium]
MKQIETKDYQDMSRKAANIVFAQIIRKGNSILGLATGSTMLGLYEELVKMNQKGDLDFSRVSSVNLDEYLGLPAINPQSYRYYMNHNLFNHINIPLENTYLPDGTAVNPDEECRKYDERIHNMGGIDLQLLGLGLDGHIGFNEPGEVFTRETHCVTLDDSTIKANARFFENEDEVPKQAITMGIGCIMQARQVLLCVNGKAKASILKEVLYGPITPKVPGSILQLHPNLVVVADKEALFGL